MRETLVKLKVRMPHKSNTCRRCKETKFAKHFYVQKRNVSGLENICKDCKRVVYAAQRYKVSEKFIEYLYTHETCMCCDDKFINRKLTHIHHTEVGVRGIICYSCNYTLGQETNEDRERINMCLKFMARKNPLNTVNPQERPIGNQDEVAVPESSETTCCETFYCKVCQRDNLHKNDFQKLKSRQFRKICKLCANKTRTILRPFNNLRKESTKCDCCNTSYTKNNKSCIHHVGIEIIAILCNRCNQIIENGSKQRMDKLQKCLRFMI